MLTMLNQVVEEFASLAVVGDQVQKMFVLQHLVQFDNVLVIVDPLHDFNLTADLFHVIF